MNKKFKSELKGRKVPGLNLHEKDNTAFEGEEERKVPRQVPVPGQS